MADPYLGEIRLFGFNFPPNGWARCDGQLLPINQNQALYSLLGTQYGGDGRTTFQLPDLRGRAAQHSRTAIGQKSGEEAHPLTINEMPAHRHVVRGSSLAANNPFPGDNVLADVSSSGFETYAGGADVDMDSSAIGNTGSGQGHNNMQPFLVVNFCIALTGLFPSRN